MDGITKVIEELGLMILARDIELKDYIGENLKILSKLIIEFLNKKKEIEELKQKIEIIEGHLEVYEEYYNQGA